MEYTVQKLSRMANVSARTLRYYDEIGILKPARINSSGYRIYGQAEVDRSKFLQAGGQNIAILQPDDKYAAYFPFSCFH